MVNPFKPSDDRWLHFNAIKVILVYPTIFNFWHSGTLALRTERQSARMSKIKNGGVDQYGPDDDEIAYFTVRWKTRKLVLSIAPKTWDNTDKDSKNRKRSH